MLTREGFAPQEHHLLDPGASLMASTEIKREDVSAMLCRGSYALEVDNDNFVTVKLGNLLLDELTEFVL